jgi:hypothetical protein
MRGLLALPREFRIAEQPNVDASGAEANGNTRQNLGSFGLKF